MGNLARRVGALETGNGVIGIGDMLDALDAPGLDLSDPRTWPAAWRGKAIDERALRALDRLDHDVLTMEEVVTRISG